MDLFGETKDFPGLKAKFQIGSVHGRITYNMEDRVFHQSDLPERAVEARTEIKKLLRPDTMIRSDKLWNVSTHGETYSNTAVAPWDQTREIDRQFKKQEAEHRIKNKEDRLNLIRAGVDPDHDQRHIHKEWNQSVSIQPAYKTKFQQKNAKPVKPKLKPKETRSLIDRQKEISEESVARRRAIREAEEEAERKRRALLDATVACRDTHSYPHDTANTIAADTRALRDPALLESKYTPDVLEEFMKTQEEAAANQQKIESRGLDSGRQGSADKLVRGLDKHRTRLLGATYVGANVILNTRKADELPTTRGSTLNRSIYTVKPKRPDSRGLPNVTPSVQWEHEGTWTFVHAEDSEAWTCCMNSEYGSKGCKKTVITRPKSWNLLSE